MATFCIVECGCGPCISALTELALVAQMYKDKLCVVSVNIEPVDDWREAFKKHPITWYNWNDGKGGAGIYDLVPTAVAFHSLYLSPPMVISSINGMVMEMER